jgi:hypothetical protein
MHSISKQVTYMKQLEAITDVNSEATANLSSTVKDVVIGSHKKFQGVTRDTLWLNVTIHSHS